MFEKIDSHEFHLKALSFPNRSYRRTGNYLLSHKTSSLYALATNEIALKFNISKQMFVLFENINKLIENKKFLSLCLL